MAAIDKTYVNKDQWILAKKFHEETFDQQIAELRSEYCRSSGVRITKLQIKNK